jgi:predicted metal-dependent hydrolase
VDEALIGRALYVLEKAAGDTSRSLYDRNRAVYELLRYGVKVKAEAGAHNETVWLIDWTHPEKNDFAIAEEVTVSGADAKAPLVAKWEVRLGVKATFAGIKRMKTKWGGCNVDAARIWLNLELCKKPVQCLEYIVVHELMHFVERHHGDRFVNLMDKHLPQWRHHRKVLNDAPLGHADWTY